MNYVCFISYVIIINACYIYYKSLRNVDIILLIIPISMNVESKEKVIIFISWMFWFPFSSGDHHKTSNVFYFVWLLGNSVSNYHDPYHKYNWIFFHRSQFLPFHIIILLLIINDQANKSTFALVISDYS